MKSFWREAKMRMLFSVLQVLGLIMMSVTVVQDCGSCHGLTLRGGLGPPLRPENLEHLSVEAIAALIREGVPGTAMPPWKQLLSPEDIHWISDQLKSGALVSP